MLVLKTRVLSSSWTMMKRIQEKSVSALWLTRGSAMMQPNHPRLHFVHGSWYVFPLLHDSLMLSLENSLTFKD